jgi:hypothetical protein
MDFCTQEIQNLFHNRGTDAKYLLTFSFFPPIFYLFKASLD